MMNTTSLFDVKNKVVVITGVCGQLGIQYANAFIAEGAMVAGIDIKSSEAILTLEQEHPKKFKFFQSDVTNATSLKESLSGITLAFDKPNVLINNAGIDSPPITNSSDDVDMTFENYSESQWDKVINVNLKGVYLCCQVFGSAMAEAREGSIINISSIYGLVSPDQSLYEYKRNQGQEFFKPAAYSASKSGVLNLTRYLSTYWAKKNVRVNSLTLAGVLNDQDKDFLEAYCNRIPIGRMADEKEYNGCLIFLSSDASSYITGSNIIADGGWTAI